MVSGGRWSQDAIPGSVDLAAPQEGGHRPGHCQTQPISRGGFIPLLDLNPKCLDKDHT